MLGLTNIGLASKGGGDRRNEPIWVWLHRREWWRPRCSTAYKIRINGWPELGLPYRGQSLKVMEQEQSWLFEVGPGSFPYL
jgi:hypothetical protein